MKRQKVSTNEGTLDDFIDRLVSSPPGNPKSIQLELLAEESDIPTAFNILIEIFSKTMRYLYGDRNGRVELDDMGPEELDKMSKYFGSFGFQLFVERVEGKNGNISSYGGTEDRPIRDNELKAHVLKIKSANYLYLIYFDELKS